MSLLDQSTAHRNPGRRATEPPDTDPAPLAEQGLTEEKKFEAELPESLATRQCSLTVLKRSLVEFRLVITILDKKHREKETAVNTNAFAIVPTYAASSDHSTTLNSILISSRHVHDQRLQILRTFDDIKLLQQALLGYRVFHAMTNVRWSINGSSEPSYMGHARTQLWQLMILKDPSLDQNNPPLHQLSSTGMEPQPPRPEPESKIRPGPRTMSTFSGLTMLSCQSLVSKVKGSRGEATALSPPSPPVFILFTSHGGKHGFLHLQVASDIILDRERCQCRSGKGMFCATIITHRKKKSLGLRRFCAQENADHGLPASWDLAFFRSPPHPNFKDIEVMPKIKYLRFDFSVPAFNTELQAEWNQLQKFHLLDIKAYNNEVEQRRKNRKSSW